jgi:Vanadium chloroperoxidase N-terminal domain/FG-GAP-like repeat/PAP2 superfamily/FG-GAP repeat
MVRTSARRSSIRTALERLEERWTPAGDMVLRWNLLALDANKLDHSIGGPAHQAGPGKSARALAIVHAAIYDAVDSIAHAYQPYEFQVAAAPGASIEAAAAAAGHDTLVALYPSMQATFDAALAQDLAGFPGPSGQAGAMVGHQVATQLLALRQNDGSQSNPPYTPSGQIGTWTPDPLHPSQQALNPGWGSVTPFGMISGTQFQAPAPPAFDSAAYTAAYNELIQLGGDGVTTPTQRTAAQTQIGIFWGYDGQPGLGTPPRLYNQITRIIATQKGNTEIQNARLFALVNIAMADAGVAAWSTKYTDNFWRPVTAIRAGDNDGNANTQGNVTWAPLGAPADNGNGTNFTPPFPAYTSGHATFGAAAFHMIADFYGTDKIPFDFTSDEFNGQTVDQNGNVRPIVTRHFDTLSQAIEENGQSRIYLGIHWSFDKTAGIAQGTAIADFIFAHTLRAKATQQRFAIGADVGGGPHVRVQETATGRFIADFFAYDTAFIGGVRVATGDVNGDGTPDIITAAGPGGGPHVKVFDGVDLHVIFSFMAYDIKFAGGVFVAAGDINGDGKADIITGPDLGGGPHVRVFSGATGGELMSFLAYSPAFFGGVHVAAGDVNGDGKADVITGAGLGGGPHVRAFSGADGSGLLSFFAYDMAFRGGVFVAGGDCDGNGRADIITGAGPGGGPHVEVFNGQGARLQSFVAALPPNPLLPNGIHVGCTDVDGDGRADLLAAAAAGSAPVVDARDAMSLVQLEQPLVYDANFLGGVFVGGVI